jgi:hypothetical protein
MKNNARKAQKPHATEEAGNHTAKPFVVKARQHKRAEKKIEKKDLERCASSGIDEIEFAVMAPFRERLGTHLRDGVGDALIQCGLVPCVVINAMQTAELLARTAVAARAACRNTGVPPSVLISMANHAGTWHRMDASGYEAFTGRTNDYFNAGENFASVEASFLDQAERLANSRRFQPVMRAAKNPAEYLKALSECVIWKGIDRKDIIQFITNYGLQECDLPAREIDPLDLGL